MSEIACPNCGYVFTAAPCCDNPAHNIGVVCSRCHQIFIPGLKLTIQDVNLPVALAKAPGKPFLRPKREKQPRGVGGVSV